MRDGAIVAILSGLDPAWITLIGTLLGASVLSVTNKWLSRTKDDRDDAKQIREELRTQITSQKTEIDVLEKEVNEWREKYYDLRDQHIRETTALQIELDGLKRQLAELVEQHGAS